MNTLNCICRYMDVLNIYSQSDIYNICRYRRITNIIVLLDNLEIGLHIIAFISNQIYNI